MEINDRFLAYLELRKDLYFYKIPLAKMSYYIDAALAYGKQQAVYWHPVGIANLCGKLDVSIIKVEEALQTSIRGQLRLAEKPEIWVYQQALKKMADSRSIPLQQLEQAVILHELFHLLEEQSKATDDQLEKICTFRFLGWHRKAKVRKTREVAAHAFVKEWLGLACLPNYWDYSWTDAGENGLVLAQLWEEFCAVGNEWSTLKEA